MGLFGGSKKTTGPNFTYVVQCLRETFGTSDLDYVFEEYVLKPREYKEKNGLEYNPKNKAYIESCIRETFGTTDLDYVFTRFMSSETRKKLENRTLLKEKIR